MSAFKQDRTLNISFSLYEYGAALPHPRDIQPPADACKQLWIPQTLADSIWIVTEFKTKRAAKQFKSTKPGVYSKTHITNCSKAFLEHWCEK